MRRTFDAATVSGLGFEASLTLLDHIAAREQGAPVSRSYSDDGDLLVIEWRKSAQTITDKLSAQINVGTERIQAARVIVTEIAEGRQAKAELKRIRGMSKIRDFAIRAPKVIAGLEARVDKLSPRLVAVETSGHGTFDRWDLHIDDQEAAIKEVEDAINLLSNGGPPLDASDE